jgi:hypothetical protein
MEQDGLRHVRHVHRRLGGDRAVGLEDSRLHPLGHLGGGVADVDLAAGDVVCRPSSAVDFVSPVIACLVAV